jgi:hypothetical protein
MAILRAFLGDFLDQSATRRRNPNWIAEGLTTAGAGIVGAGSFWSFIENVAKPIFGEWANLFQLVLLIGAILWFGSLICAKVTRAKSLKPAPTPHVEYQFSQPVRILSKVALIVLICALPVKARNVYYDVRPLPPDLYGVLKDPSARPIAGGHIVILTSDDDNITVSSNGPDTDGFYHIVAKRPVRRSDHLRYRSDFCSVILPVDHAHQIAAQRENVTGQMLSPMFSHTVICQEK